jgi:hypothetical protein
LELLLLRSFLILAISLLFLDYFAVVICAGEFGRNVSASLLSENTICAEGCESNIWPRVIVGVITEGAAEPGEKLIRARIRFDDGSLQTGHLQGCPDTPSLVCTYSFFTAPRDRQITLIVETINSTLPAVEATIILGRFNYCGREIAYVEIWAVPGAPPRIGPSRLVSPCETADTVWPIN